MAQRGRPSITKRSKELSRMEKRAEKAERLARRRRERVERRDGGDAGGEVRNDTDEAPETTPPGDPTGAEPRPAPRLETRPPDGLAARRRNAPPGRLVEPSA
jgi:hypothetical protein